MRPCVAAPPGLALAASLLLVSCESPFSVESSEFRSAPARALATYFPPSEANGGWRKRTDTQRIRELGMDPARLSQLGGYLMSQPYEAYKTGVSGYDPTNKAAIVVKRGWIVGEYW